MTQHIEAPAKRVVIEAPTKREAISFYQRVEAKLGLAPVRSDVDLARLVKSCLPLSSLDTLSHQGINLDEIYSYIVPRRTLTHRKTNCKPLSLEESDRAVRMARIVSQAEEVFGNNDKAARWLRKAKARFGGQSPMEMLRTEAGARIVEETLLQLDYGFTA